MGRSAHINSLWTFEERREELKRITTVLESDTDSDCVMNTNSKLKLVGGTVRCDWLEDIDRWKEEFSENLTEEPGETELVEFSIETGDADPIAQHPYMTALGLRQGVEEELELFLRKGYIWKSSSLWASPIVTVRKPKGKYASMLTLKRSILLPSPCPFTCHILRRQ